MVFSLVVLVTIFFGNFSDSSKNISAILLGAFIVTILNSWHQHAADKRNYVINANKVLIVLSAQLNELINIGRKFDEFIENKRADRPALILSENEWHLSKSELMQLMDDNENIIKIIYDLMFFDEQYIDLKNNIRDYLENRTKLMQGHGFSGFVLPLENISESDCGELDRLECKIKQGINTTKLKTIIDNLLLHLKDNYPGQKFVQYSIREPESEAE